MNPVCCGIIDCLNGLKGACIWSCACCGKLSHESVCNDTVVKKCSRLSRSTEHCRLVICLDRVKEILYTLIHAGW